LTINGFGHIIHVLIDKTELKMSRYPRRTTQDRQAEAKVFRARSEASHVPTVDLNKCEYDKQRKVLKLASEYFGMPLTFYVKSHHTGKVVRFVPVNPADPLFDEDHWDGEQQLYRPVEGNTNVDYMVIYHAY
jgi:hypothetical protein